MMLLNERNAHAMVTSLGVALVYFLALGIILACILGALLVFIGDRPRIRYAFAWLTLLAMAASIPATVFYTIPASVVVALDAEGDVPLEQASATRQVPMPSKDDVASSGNQTALEAKSVDVDLLPVTSREAPQSREPQPLHFNFRKVDQSADGMLPFISTFAPWVTAGWGVGVIVMVLWRLQGWYRIHQILQASIEPISAPVRESAQRIAARLGVRVHYRLRLTSAVACPMVIGWMRPVILFPVRVMSGLSNEEIEMILAHELAHLRRFDHLAQLLQLMIETCLFYHPAVWWVSGQIRIAREASCDDLASQVMENRVAYASALVRLEELRQIHSGWLDVPFGVSANGGSLLTRVHRLVGIPRQESTAGMVGLVFVGFAAASIAFGVMAVMVSADSSPQALHVAAVGQTDQATPPPAEPSPRKSKEKPAAPQTKEPGPCVIEVFPPVGAKDVSPETELRIRFDRPMNPSQMSLWYLTPDNGGFKMRGDIRYDADRNEFVVPVWLKPERVHEIYLNYPEHKGWGEEFRSVEGDRAVPFLWSFAVGPVPQNAAPKPTVLSIDPKNRSEVACVTPVRIRFDRPMDPSCLLTATALIQDEYDKKSITDWFDATMNSELVDCLIEVTWNEEQTAADLLLQLRPNWKGAIVVAGFRTQEQAVVDPISIEYRTQRKPISDEILARVKDPKTEQVVSEILARMNAMRRQIRSGAVETTSLSFSPGQPWSSDLRSYGFSFLFQGDSQFVGDVSTIMERKFRVGSDGSHCWCEVGNELVEVPVDQIHERIVRSAFHPIEIAPQEELIMDRDFELNGAIEVVRTVSIRGRECFLLRSWKLSRPANNWNPMTDLYLDMETYLPLKVVHHGYGGTYSFAYSRINEEFPKSDFQPSPVEGIVRKPLEPLDEGYEKYYLKVDDGTRGRASVRWGTVGPKGSRTGGLN